MFRLLSFCVASLTLFPIATFADTPANCTFEEIAGSWTFSVGERGHDNTLNCTGFTGPVSKTLTVELYFPDRAFDNYGNEGFWTLIYNQGFEVVINNRKYLAFSKYVSSGGGNYTSVCSETMPGWSHNVDGKDWACYFGKKDSDVSDPKFSFVKESSSLDQPFKPNLELVEQINSAQKSWTAAVYDKFAENTLREMTRRTGGSPKGFQPPKAAPVTAEVKAVASTLPLEFDWRDVDGQNFVTPVRDQESCGSCFAFSSTGMYEARLKVMTNNTVSLVFSPQDVVQCSNYSQGCEGGFPYLVAGKYADDFGFVEESCLPYTGQDAPCSGETRGCKRYYATKYHYVGGFYGACNDQLMKIALVKNGPLSVSFMVYQDFQYYTGGIYHHTGLRDRFNPFQITNHAVLLVGYGYDHETGEKFWIVKNSWGEGWGEKGYFRIRRGGDECAIESCAVETFPIP